MKLYDKTTGEVIADITTNHSMSIDDALQLMHYTVTEDGQIRDEDSDELFNAWYDDLETEEDTDAIVAKLAEYEYTDDARKIVEAGLYNVAVELMDDDIRESLHIEIAPCDDVTFLAAYMARHSQKYGEEFRVD